MKKIDYPDIGESIFLDTLPNGLKISIIPKPGYTRCYAFFATNYGGADRRFRLGGEFVDTPAGVAHFLEHKMFDMPNGENTLAVLEANGANPNAYTSSGITAYYFESTTNFYENLNILLRFVSTPYFTPESVAKEQGIIAQEIRMYEDDPGSVVFEELMKSLYAHHPIRDCVAGTVESIAEISADTLYDCHKVFYNPGNMCLCVVGDVDAEKVRAAALEILPDDGGEVPGRDYGEEETLLPLRTRFKKAMEVSAPQFMIGAKAPCCDGGPELLSHKLVSGASFNYLLGQSSPLYNKLYADGLLNTDFFCEAYYACGTLTLLTGGESNDPEAVFEAICAEVDRIKVEGIDEALFTRLRKAAYGSRIRALSNFSGLCSSMADSAFSGYNCLDSFAAVRKLTSDDIYKFITENFARERLSMSVIVPLAEDKEV